MSWKIYNGMILQDTTLEDALAKAKALREACLPEMQKAIQEETARRLALWADLQVNGLGSTLPEKGQSIQSDIIEAKKKVLGDGFRCPDWDYSFDLCFIPQDGNILTLFFTERDPGFTDEMEKLGFEDFHYQNCTDKPSEISDEDWDAREEAWRKTGQMDYIAPSEVGLQYDVITWRDISMAALDMKAVEAVQLDSVKRGKAVSEIKAEHHLKSWIQDAQPRLSKIIERVREIAKEIEPEMKLADEWFEISRVI